MRDFVQFILNALYDATIYQGKGSDKKIAKTGKQAKKVKVETESRNIKDMFSRASRRGK
jgi:ribonuclease H2 subunit B